MLTCLRQVRDLQLSVSQPFGEAVQCFFQTLGALAVAFYSSSNLTLIVICSVPVLYIVMAFLSKMLSKRAHEQSDKLEQALNYVTNALRNIDTVKFFNGEHFELQRYRNIIAQAGDLYNRQANLRSLQLGVMQFFTLSIFVQGFWYGNNLVINGERNAGQVLTTFWAALMAVSGVTGFLPQFVVLQKGQVAGERLIALISHISEADPMTETGGHQKPETCVGAIEFRNVSYQELLVVVSLNIVGLIFVPVPSRSSSFTRRFHDIPRRLNYIRDRKEWFGEEHTRPATCAILSTYLWPDST